MSRPRARAWISSTACSSLIGCRGSFRACSAVAGKQLAYDPLQLLSSGVWELRRATPPTGLFVCCFCKEKREKKRRGSHPEGPGGLPAPKGVKGGSNPLFFILAPKPKNPIPPSVRPSTPGAGYGLPQPGHQLSAGEAGREEGSGQRQKAEGEGRCGTPPGGGRRNKRPATTSIS